MSRDIIAKSPLLTNTVQSVKTMCSHTHSIAILECNDAANASVSAHVKMESTADEPGKQGLTRCHKTYRNQEV